MIRLLLIYNLTSGAPGAVFNRVRTIFRLGGCALYAMTGGGERAAWRARQAELGLPVDEYYRDTMPAAIGEQVEGHLPCIAAHTNAGYTLLVSPAAIRRCRGDAADLQGRIRYYLAANHLIS
jgi:hypothetical protein